MKILGGNCTDMSSYSYFIHIPKTGGIAIKQSSVLETRVEGFSKRNLPTNYTQRYENTTGRKGNHCHARWRDTGLSTKQPCFAIVRNPFARMVSRYTYAMNKLNRPQKLSFEEFIETRHEHAHKEFNWHEAADGWTTQKDYVVDTDNTLRCDVMRLE